MRVEILRDLIAIATKAYPPPAWSDEAAVQVWVGNLVSACVPVAYDLIKSDPATLSAKGEPHAAEIEEAYKSRYADGGYEKIGDGKILAWLQTINWAQLIQTVITIISIIPKAPTPDPAA